MVSPSEKAAYKLLTAAGSLPTDTLEKAMKLSETGKQSFWKNLSEVSGLTEYALYEELAKHAKIPVVALKKTAIDAKALQKVPVKIAWYYKFFPFKFEDGKVWGAVSQIPDVSILDEIRFGIGVDVTVAFAPEKDIEEMLNKHYGLGADMVNKIILSQDTNGQRHQTPASTHQVEDLENLAETASIAQLVNQIILEAYKKRASDIHLEPYRGKVRLRYRIDGALHEAPVPAEINKFFSPMLARIKIMSNLNVVEKRLPQDGKMRVKAQDQTLDLRVSSIPTAHGESMVIRILPGKNVWSLDSLGFDAVHLRQIQNLLQRPNGIVFVTGPTGSGKSTTLYACLTALNAEDRKIITIEDPVEYELDGISQIQVAADIGLTFSQGLRSVLRHDPDVLMVGEVRDLETADISIRAALTGHLILSTLHTNDAASGITRLTDIGVERYLVASSVIAFIAQRLVRLICTHCKEPSKDVDPKVMHQMMEGLGLDSPKKVIVYHGRGCDHCSNTGFSGRQAIHEILILNDELRKAVMDGTPAGLIKKQAMKLGMKTLLQDGFQKVLQGLTTPDEILKVAPSDHEHSEAVPDHEGQLDVVFLPVENGSESADKSADGSRNPEGKPLANQRKYKRVPAHLPITYRIIEYQAQHPQLAAIKETLPQKNWDGNVENLSAGGLLYSSDNLTLEDGGGAETAEMTIGDAIEAGSILELQIHLPDGEKPPRCIGRVLRVTRTLKLFEAGSKFVFHIAVLFLVINSVDRQRIEKFCESAGDRT
ncbi:MAG TPA: hypothetical protein DIS66_08050 [Candidatus Omnitrophica bacterium]|mgnify:FL=1|nr:hypothetical protein [Candidatus Omnitrophota bacterium]